MNFDPSDASRRQRKQLCSTLTAFDFRGHFRAERVRTAFPVLLVLALLLGGCVTSIGPTISERTLEQLGPYPDDYRAIAKRWIEDSVWGISGIDTLSVSKPRPGFADSILTRRRFGWWTQVRFQARDRLGLPKGQMSWALLIHDSEVVARQKRLN